MGKKCATILLGVVGLVLIVIGITFIFAFPPIYDKILNKNSYLAPGSMVWDDWVCPNDYPIYMSFYFFNVNNPDEILRGEKPNVTQVGPLVYRELQQKFDIAFTEDNTIYYLNNKTYVFDEERTVINESYVVMTTNILLFSVYNSANSVESLGLDPYLNEFAKSDDPELANAASPFYEVEVGNMLWGYYDNPLLVAMNATPLLSPTVNGVVTFGLQYNLTNDGLYEVYNGEDDDNKDRATVNTWNNSTTLSYWATPECNCINGTDGTIFRTFLDDDERLYIYMTQLCRTMWLVKESTQKIKGVETTRYAATEQLFQVDFEDNFCYCKDGELSLCDGNGLLDTSKCYEELTLQMTGSDLTLSVIMSSPQFLYADNSTIDQFIGIDPVEEKYQTFLDIQLETGILAAAAKRIQMNTYINKKSGLVNLKSLKHLKAGWKQLMPIFWGEEGFPVDDDLLSQLYDATVLPARIVNITCYCLIGIGVVMIVAALLILICADAKNHQEERTPILTKEKPIY